jgi:hypothetical protein
LKLSGSVASEFERAAKHHGLRSRRIRSALRVGVATTLLRSPGMATMERRVCVRRPRERGCAQPRQ